MSEANTPNSSQSNSEPQKNGSSNWYSDWDTFFKESEIAPPPVSADDSTPAAQPAAAAQWHTVNFPNAISADAIERQAMYAANPEEPVAPWSARTITPNAAAASVDQGASSEELDVVQLISLIQELNQCNSALLDRVSQLEDVLEQTQTTLKTEREQLHSSNNETVASTQDQVNQLFNELEQAHQTSQRQQVLVENLTQQLAVSQERAAQLERDCAFLQEQNQEQLQRLMLSEHTCQDLRVRLQRQQQYTMQFKAALERCLEVPGTPTPVWEGGLPTFPTQEPLAASATPPLIPKVRQIQPWSAQPGGLPLKLDALLNRQTSAPSDSAEYRTIGEFAELSEVLAVSNSSEEIAQPVEPVSEPAAEVENEPVPGAELFETDAGFESIASEMNSISPEAQAMMEELLKQPLEVSQSGFDLWSHLAKLVGVPIDELPQTDASEAEAASAAALQPEESSVQPSANPPQGLAIKTFEVQPSSIPQSAARKLLTMPFEGGSSGSLAIDQPAAAGGEAMTAASPSPVVYPLRATKKITSLAAVDLPSFPRP